MNINAIKFNTNPVITKIGNKTQNTNQPIKNQNNLETPNGYYNKLITNISFKRNANSKPNLKERFEGCLIGGAVGDALGLPVEFFTIDTIRKNYGKQGIEELENGYSGFAEFSDDTQMTIFTADGILKAIGDKFSSRKEPQIVDMHNSYLNWYKTQNEIYDEDRKKDGWLINQLSLYERKHPGETCLTALRSGEIGTIESPINNSKGSGGVMRVAPIGLLYHNSPKIAFTIATKNAALTHGHPSGYLSAGFMAALIANITNGLSLSDSVENSLKILVKKENSKELTKEIIQAISLAQKDISPELAIKELGCGFTGDEAIAISLYCALKSENNYEDAVKMAVNHSGDSDTTGAITGNIMGTLLGINKIPEKWTNKIQSKNLLIEVANDLINVPKNPLKYKHKYPYNKGRIPNWYKRNAIGQRNSQKLNLSIFSEEEIKKMEGMTTEELIKYKKELLKSYNLN